MRYCQKHRGMETAEEGICEVAGALLLAHVDSPCELMEVLVIVKEDGEWPHEYLPTIAVAVRVGVKKGRTFPPLDLNQQQAEAIAEAALQALDSLAAGQGRETGDQPRRVDPLWSALDAGDE